MVNQIKTINTYYDKPITVYNEDFQWPIQFKKVSAIVIIIIY